LGVRPCLHRRCLALERATPDELTELLVHALQKAGAIKLMTPELIATLADHAQALRGALSFADQRLQLVAFASQAPRPPSVVPGPEKLFRSRARHGEHDFGSFELCGRRFFWKIDYERAMKYGSEDPSDPAQTTRVLTVMLADEY
jgi:hypothetical protein